MIRLENVEKIYRTSRIETVALSGIARFPMRVKCASLSWHTMNAALREGSAVADVPAVSTE